MRARGLYSTGPGFEDPDYFGAKECLLFLDGPDQQEISGNRKGHKDHFPLSPAQACASIDKCLNSDPECFGRLSGFVHIF
jgi:hypothetical protein